MVEGGLVVIFDADACGSWIEELFGDGEDVVPEAAGFGSGLFESVDDPGVHPEAAHDEEGDSVEGWDIEIGLSPLLDPVDRSRGVLGHLQFFGDEIRGSCPEVIERDLVFNEFGECVMNSAVASDDDESVGVPDFACWGEIVGVDYEDGVRSVNEKCLASFCELLGLVSA
mgnify:CR=1 FL=1